MQHSTHLSILKNLSSNELNVIKHRDERRKARVEEAVKSLDLAYTKEEIKNAVKKMAQAIYDKHHENTSVVFLTMLNGGSYIATDIKRYLDKLGWNSFEEGSVLYTSYGQGFENGTMQVKLPPEENMVRGRIVIAIDDLMESGKTANRLKDDCLKLGALDVEFGMLIDKVDMRKTDVNPTYSGFKRRGDDWLVGDGLDQDKVHRNTTDISILTKEGQKNYLNSLNRDIELDKKEEEERLIRKNFTY